MTTLAIDTSSARGSAAVAADGAILDIRRFDAPRGRGGALFSALEDLRPSWAGLDRLALGIGPGAYNGLRASCALAGSFRLALGLDLVAVPSVCLLDAGTTDYFALGDARGGRVYRAEVRGRRLLGQPELLDAAGLAAFLAQPPLLPAFRIGTVPGAGHLPEAFPDAAILALAAADLPPADPAAVSPLYLKPPHITMPRQALA